jgi:hypothetical protein
VWTGVIPSGIAGASAIPVIPPGASGRADFPKSHRFATLLADLTAPQPRNLGSVDGTQSGKGGRIEKTEKLCGRTRCRQHPNINVASARGLGGRDKTMARKMDFCCDGVFRALSFICPITPHARRSGNDIHLVWGPGRHIIGHNIAIYHRNADKVRVAFFTEMDQVKDEALGYFDPRPWHQDRPQRPKVWGPDTLRNYWGFGSEPAIRGYQTIE